MQFPASQWKRVIVLILMVCALSSFSLGRTPDNFSLTLRLTRGESSRDSNSKTTTITIKRQRLSYDVAYYGSSRSRMQPVHKEFEITSRDIEKLKSIVLKNGLLKSDSTFNFLNGNTGFFYFELAIELQLGRRKSSIKISAPITTAKLKDEPLYKNSNALLKEVYRLLSNQDQELIYEEPVK